MIDSAENPAPSSHVVASSAAPKPKPAPAKKKPAAKPVPVVKESLTARPAATECPTGDPMMGMKDPKVIRWHLAKHPDRMSSIYGEWNWRAMLAAHPETPDLEA